LDLIGVIARERGRNNKLLPTNEDPQTPFNHSQ
jgi:hypothetical protein